MVDTQDTRSSRGLSRRDMIKGAAVAGAAAWTAPVIIDSLTSPAAAVSNCNPIFIKIQVSNNCCYCADPCCSVVNSYPNACCGSNGCNSTITDYPCCSMPTVSGGNVTLPTGAQFSSQTGGAGGPIPSWWGIVGRYDGNAGTLAQAGTYSNGGTSGSVPTSITSGHSTSNLTYVYLQYCAGPCATKTAGHCN